MTDAQEEEKEKERLKGELSSYETGDIPASSANSTDTNNSVTREETDTSQTTPPMDRRSKVTERKGAHQGAGGGKLDPSSTAPGAAVPRTTEERVLLAKKMMVLKQKEKLQEIEVSEKRAFNFLQKLEKEKARKVTERKRRESEKRRDFEDRKKRLVTEENEKRKQILEKASSDVVSSQRAGSHHSKPPEYRRRALSLLSGKEPNYTTPTVAYQIRTSRPTPESITPVTCSRYRSVSPERYRSKSADFRLRSAAPSQRSKSTDRSPRTSAKSKDTPKRNSRRSKTSTPPRAHRPTPSATMLAADRPPKPASRNMSSSLSSTSATTTTTATTTTSESQLSSRRDAEDRSRRGAREPTPSRQAPKSKVEAPPLNIRQAPQTDKAKEPKAPHRQTGTKTNSTKSPPNAFESTAKQVREVKEVKKTKEVKHSKEVKPTKETKPTKEVRQVTEVKGQSTGDAISDDSCSEDYKSKMLELRRLARERAKKQAEEDLAKLNRAREEEAEREKELQEKREEERQKRQEEEKLKAEEARRKEEEQNKKDAEENKIKEEQLKQKMEQEAKERELAEAKAREESLQKEKERQEKAKREEDERIARKKKLDSIMKRVKPTNETKPEGTSTVAGNSRAEADVITQAPIEQVSSQIAQTSDDRPETETASSLEPPGPEAKKFDQSDVALFPSKPLEERGGNEAEHSSSIVAVSHPGLKSDEPSRDQTVTTSSVTTVSSDVTFASSNVTSASSDVTYASSDVTFASSDVTFGNISNDKSEDDLKVKVTAPASSSPSASSSASSLVSASLSESASASSLASAAALTTEVQSHFDPKQTDDLGGTLAQGQPSQSLDLLIDFSDGFKEKEEQNKELRRDVTATSQSKYVVMNQSSINDDDSSSSSLSDVIMTPKDGLNLEEFPAPGTNIIIPEIRLQDDWSKDDTSSSVVSMTSANVKTQEMTSADYVTTVQSVTSVASSVEQSGKTTAGSSQLSDQESNPRHDKDSANASYQLRQEQSLPNGLVEDEESGSGKQSSFSSRLI